MINELRLTLSSGVPVADSASSSFIYLTPYVGNRIELWDGAFWTIKRTSQVSIALSGLTADTNYDIFAYHDANLGVQLEFSIAWTGAGTRGLDIVRLDGVYVKATDHTRRYIGTFRAASATTTVDSVLKRFLWNHHNQVERPLAVVDTTNSWTYLAPNSVWRQANASTANAFEYITGLSGMLTVEVRSLAFCSVAAAATRMAAVGISTFNTTFNQATLYGAQPNSTTLYMTLYATYRADHIGYKKVYWLETGSTAVDYTFAGDGGTTVGQTGMTGMISG